LEYVSSKQCFFGGFDLLLGQQIDAELRNQVNWELRMAKLQPDVSKPFTSWYKQSY